MPAPTVNLSLAAISGPAPKASGGAAVALNAPSGGQGISFGQWMQQMSDSAGQSSGSRGQNLPPEGREGKVLPGTAGQSSTASEAEASPRAGSGIETGRSSGAGAEGEDAVGSADARVRETREEWGNGNAHRVQGQSPAEAETAQARDRVPTTNPSPEQQSTAQGQRPVAVSEPHPYIVNNSEYNTQPTVQHVDSLAVSKVSPATGNQTRGSNDVSSKGVGSVAGASAEGAGVIDRAGTTHTGKEGGADNGAIESKSPEKLVLAEDRAVASSGDSIEDEHEREVPREGRATAAEIDGRQVAALIASQPSRTAEHSRGSSEQQADIAQAQVRAPKGLSSAEVDEPLARSQRGGGDSGSAGAGPASNGGLERPLMGSDGAGKADQRGEKADIQVTRPVPNRVGRKSEASASSKAADANLSARVGDGGAFGQSQFRATVSAVGGQASAQRTDAVPQASNRFTQQKPVASGSVASDVTESRRQSNRAPERTVLSSGKVQVIESEHMSASAQKQASLGGASGKSAEQPTGNAELTPSDTRQTSTGVSTDQSLAGAEHRLNNGRQTSSGMSPERPAVNAVHAPNNTRQASSGKSAEQPTGNAKITPSNTPQTPSGRYNDQPSVNAGRTTIYTRQTSSGMSTDPLSANAERTTNNTRQTSSGRFTEQPTGNAERTPNNARQTGNGLGSADRAVQTQESGSVPVSLRVEGRMGVQPAEVVSASSVSAREDKLAQKIQGQSNAVETVSRPAAAAQAERFVDASRNEGVLAPMTESEAKYARPDVSGNSAKHVTEELATQSRGQSKDNNDSRVSADRAQSEVLLGESPRGAKAEPEARSAASSSVEAKSETPDLARRSSEVGSVSFEDASRVVRAGGGDEQSTRVERREPDTAALKPEERSTANPVAEVESAQNEQQESVVLQGRPDVNHQSSSSTQKDERPTSVSAVQVSKDGAAMGISSERSLTARDTVVNNLDQLARAPVNTNQSDSGGSHRQANVGASQQVGTRPSVDPQGPSTPGVPASVANDGEPSTSAAQPGRTVPSLGGEARQINESTASLTAQQQASNSAPALSQRAEVAAGTLAMAQRLQDPAWGRAMGQRAVMMAQYGPRSAEIQLDPPELGAMQIRVHIGHGDQVSVTFTSPNAAVRDALEQQMPRLREMFSEQGLDLNQSTVSDQSTRERNDDSPDRRGGGRGGQYAGDEGAADVPATAQSVPVGLVDYYA